VAAIATKKARVLIAYGRRLFRIFMDSRIR
jgi:hypothetical protein